MTIRMLRFMRGGVGSRGRRGRINDARVRLGLEQQLAAGGPEMEDFENGNENDAEGGRGIGGHEAGLDDAQRNQDERDDGAAETEVKPGVKQMVLVLQKLELDARRDLLAADFRQLDQAGGVNETCSTKNSSRVSRLGAFISFGLASGVATAAALPTPGKRSRRGNSAFWLSWARNGSLRSRTTSKKPNANNNSRNT